MAARRPPESSVRQSLPSPSPPPSHTHTQPEASASSRSTWYLHHLDSHIASSYKHVLGQPSSASYHTPAGQFASSSTVVPPTNCIWTPDEKSRFFAALSRYSRHRPDLIAGDTGKTEAEVGYYIALLDSGSEGSRSTDGVEFTSIYGRAGAGGVEAKNRRALRDKNVRWDGSRTWREGLAPAAREVSDKWVARENVLSDQLSSALRERDDEAEYISQSKRRRMERNEANSTIHVDPSLTPYEKRRLLESGPHLAPLEQRWKIEDWGEKLTRDKLSQLNSLMQPEWAEWYGRRVRTPSPTRVNCEKSTTPSLCGESDLEDNNNNINNDQTPDTPSAQGQSLKADKTAKIARERKEYDELCAIPKKDRNPEQRKRLTVILNRKRNREEYRTKKLMNEGLTMEEIEAAGGADIIYAKRERQKEIGDMGGTKRKPGIAKKKRGLSLESDEGKEMGMGMMYKDEMANATLKRMGMYEYVIANGLEVFNYNELAKRFPSQNSTQSPQAKAQAQPQLSFSVLRLLHAELVFHLRHLLHRAMTIAELAYIQSPPSIVKEDEEAGAGPEMSADHVRQALALVGSSIFQDDDVGEDEEDHGPAQMRRKRYEESFLPPNNIPWDLLPSLRLPLPLSVNHNSDLTDIEDDESQEEGAETEEEEDNLEKVLESIDEEHDKKYEQALWRAERDTSASASANAGGGGEEKVLVDLGASWLVRSTQFTGEAARKPIERSEREREYINLLMATGAARRQRRLGDSRQARFPTTRLKKLAAARGFAVSEAIVVDSDTELEDEDELDELDEDEQDAQEGGRDGVEESVKGEFVQGSEDEDEKGDDEDEKEDDEDEKEDDDEGSEYE